MATSLRLIGRGLYSVPEAERLTAVSTGRIRRWMRGYSWGHGGVRHSSPPIIATQIERINGSYALDFGDLIEIRFLDAFRKHGVGWRAIRIASERASQLIGHRHPFSTRKFKTDGRTILAELVKPTGEASLLDLVRNQYAFEQVISPFLYLGLEFGSHDEPMLWRPLGIDREVVIDPTRAFGAPIVRREGVPTRVLYYCYMAEGSIEAAASWYDVDQKSARDAIEYEQSLAA